MGAPSFLNPFLILIEIVRIRVRPITLSVRLVANIAAGHIVLSLIGSYFVSLIFLSTMTATFLAFIQLFYTIFEFAICMIQAYIGYIDRKYEN